MWLWIHALRIETEIRRERMHKGALVTRHRLESKSSLFFISSKEPELFLLYCRPCRVLLIHVQGGVRVRDVIALVLRVNVQGDGKLVVSLETCTLFIAFQCLLGVPVSLLRRCAFNLLLDSLTLTSHKDLVLTGLLFLARRGEMTRGHAWMAAYTELLTTGLPAGLFALSGAMTLLLAFVSTTSESLATYVSTANI
jgi:hypothetical protein